MKKWLYVMIAAVCVLSFAVIGCAKPAPAPPTKPAAPPTKPAAEKVWTLTWEHWSTPTHRCFINTKRWGDAVMEASNGRIKFLYHTGGEPVPVRESLDALGKGTIDVLDTVCGYFSGKIGIGDFLLMPTNFRTYPDYFDMMHRSDVGKIIDKVYREKANCTVLNWLGIFAAEGYIIGKKAKKIRHFEDFAGMKVRAAGGMPNETVKCLGGSPVTLIAGEIYTGMQRGTVDAGLLPFYCFEAYGLWEVADQYVYPEIFPVCGIPVWMNLDVWNSFPEDLQKMMIDLAHSPEMEKAAMDYVKEQDARIEEIGREKYGIEFYTLPEEDQAKMFAAVAPVWDLYIENCEKQGVGAEARQIEKLIHERFFKE